MVGPGGNENWENRPGGGKGTSPDHFRVAMPSRNMVSFAQHNFTPDSFLIEFIGYLRIQCSPVLLFMDHVLERLPVPIRQTP